jgi:acetyl-CoA C-acetyltransferase
MGNAADLCATTYNITREDQDNFAIESYTRSQNSVNSGLFKNEIVPVVITGKKGDSVTIDKDEEPFNVKFDKIPSLRPAFTKEGTATAANSSTMNDGASALVLMSREKATELGLTPIARIVSYADAEQAPEWFTTAPALVVPKAVAKAGLSMDDISYYELNEAFSVVALANAKLMNLSADKVNVNGGAVALGHPLCSSGSRIIVTLINVLHQKGGQYGAAGICNGGGGGRAVVIEKL